MVSIVLVRTETWCRYFVDDDLWRALKYGVYVFLDFALKYGVDNFGLH